MLIAAPAWPAAFCFAVLAVAFVALLKRYLRGKAVWRYDTRAAWLRAFAYFSVCWAIACAVGTVPTILSNPLVLPGQTDDWLWWVLGGLALVVVLIGYGVIWPAGTRPHGRRIVWPDTLLFGVAWGVSEGLLFGSVWLASKRFFDGWLGAGTLADSLTLAVTIVVLSAFLGLWHALYWDIHVSPEHNIAEWNIRKVLFAHTPNLVVSGIWVTAYEDLALFVALQALALVLSSMAMPFPTFRRPHPPDPEGPRLGTPIDEPADMTGRTVVITGAAHGIGREIASRIADQGADVVILDHDLDTGAAVAEAIGGRLLPVELADPDSIRAVAERLRSECPRIDVLINNAGIFTVRRSTAPSGQEQTLAVNHLGGFLLTHLLADLLADSQARVIFTSSDAHRQAKRPNFADLRAEQLWPADRDDPNRGFVVYNLSKLLVASATVEWAERWRDTGVTMNSVTPGALVVTGIFDEVTGPFKLFIRTFRPLLRTPARAAETAVYLATSPEVDGVTGWYFKDRRPTKESALAGEPQFRRDVWQWSTATVGL
jgi:NAD(P)-dependent dehydrogenase (short-subunit alcohol dehydrogenase family)